MITPSKQFWEVFKNTDGALSCTEAVAIMNIAAQAPKGEYIELGTHKGKSAMSALIGLKNGVFHLVDPIFEDEKLRETVSNTLAPFAKDGTRLNLIANTSLNVIERRDSYTYIFLDSGDHDSEVMKEISLLETRVAPNGILAFHDLFAQFIKVTEAYEYLLGTGKFEPIIIEWDKIIEYVNANNLEDGNLSWHHTELKNPCFVGAVKRK